MYKNNSIINFNFFIKKTILSFIVFSFAVSQDFIEHMISNSADGADEIHAADLDNDGDMDVLSASYYDNKIAWYENDGTGLFIDEHIISNNALGARGVYTADIDNDGDIDVLSASNGDDKIAWYENDGEQNFT